MSFYEFKKGNVDVKVDIFGFDFNLQMLVIFVGAIAAIISGITSHSRFGERAGIHRSSGAKYASISRNIDLLLINHLDKDNFNNECKSKITDIIDDWNQLSEDSPLTPLYEKNRLKSILLKSIELSFIIISFYLLFRAIKL